jgi:hypothetical protein
VVTGVQTCALPVDNSFPGFYSDKTPYGAIIRGLGLHVLKHDPTLGEIKKRTGEARLTLSAKTDEDWFAEMFMVYVTNPMLLRSIRPETYSELKSRFRTVTKGWPLDVLEGTEGIEIEKETLVTLAKKLFFVLDMGPKKESETYKKSGLYDKKRG